MKKLALDQNREYIYPVWENNKCSVIQKQIYGGKDSTTVPCGFVTEMLFQKKYISQKRRNKKLNNYMKALNKRGNISLQQLPNG